jgi:hypothetical protein
MKKFSVGLLSLGAIAIAASTTTSVGCSSGGGGSTGTAGTSGNGIDLVPNADGFFDGMNDAGIMGAWYSYGDWYNPTAGSGDCAVMGGFSAAECSSITTPTPGEPFANTGGKMCTSGTVAKVVPMAGSTTPAYSAIWGAGIGFDLNNAGNDGGTGKNGWDATAKGITGFSFDIDSPPVGGQMRVEFPTNAALGTTDINAAYWGGAGANLSPINTGKTYSFKLSDVGGPSYLTSPMPFDKTKILSMQFHVVAGTSSTIPFQYCISNLKALKD